MIKARIRSSYALAYPALESPRALRSELQTLHTGLPRRLNRFTELALLGALRCVQAVGLPNDCDLSLATGHGYADDMARLLEGVWAEQPPMPVDFINASGSSTGFYLAQTLALTGQNHTLSAGSASFEAAVYLAWSRLINGSGSVLLGGVDSAGYPLSAHRARLGLAETCPVIEISSWLLLEKDDVGAAGSWLFEPRYYPELAALLEDLHSLSADVYSLGNGLTAGQREAVLSLLTQPVLPTVPPGTAPTQAAYALADWLQQPAAPERLLHLNATDSGGFYLLQLEKRC